MQQQHNQKLKSFAKIPDDFAILNLIKITYSSKNTQQIKRAQAQLYELTSLDAFIQKLFQFLQKQDQLKIQNAEDFKLAVSNLIKKFSYQFSKEEDIHKEPFVQKLFTLLISKLKSKPKEQLGVALEYILNNDQEYKYRPQVFQRVALVMEESIQEWTFEGSLIISVACLNCLAQVEDQINFFTNIFPSLAKQAVRLLQTLRTRPVQTLTFPDSKYLMKLSHKVFELMQIAISRAVQQQDLIEDIIQQLRNNSVLQQLLFSYLNSFGSSKSILSTIPQINQQKQVIMEILFQLYRDKPLPENIFNLCFLTLLLEPQRDSYEEEQEHILTRIMELLQGYLQGQIYQQAFHEHKMQLLMCLLMYSVTKETQFDMMEDDPERFVELTEQFTEAFKGSVHIKVRAACFIKVMVNRFDQALKNILEIVIIVIQANMQSNNPSSPSRQLYQNLKQSIPDFIFFQLSQQLQIQTCFNMLSVLTPFISRRPDLNKVVYAILITHFDKIRLIESPIVVLRLMRLIGYYPTAIYYEHIKIKILSNKLYALQGMKAFQRILKGNRYPELFEALAELFQDLVNVITVNDKLFEIIILNHYDRVLKVKLKLFQSFLIKLRDTFVVNCESSLHISMLCLTYVYNMLNKESEKNFKQMIITYFAPMEDYVSSRIELFQQSLQSNKKADIYPNQFSKKILKALNSYEDKIIDIYSLLVKKQVIISDRMIQFTKRQLKFIGNHNKNAQIFKMYNQLFLKIENGFQQITLYYNAFMGQIRNMFMPLISNQQASKHSNPKDHHHKLQTLPNLSYLVSQILASFYMIHLGKSDLIWMVKSLPLITQQIRQYLLLIILTYTYTQPIQLKQILQSQKIYEDTLKFLLTTIYNEKLISKTFLLAMSKLLEIQEIYFQDIMRGCIKYFKQQFVHNKVKILKKQYVDPRMRRMLSDQYEHQEEEEQEIMEARVEHKNSKIGAKQVVSVPDFKHPFEAHSEYDQFKVRVWQNSDVIDKLNQNDKNQLRDVLQMDWFGTKVRKIVQVKKPQGIRSFGGLDNL